MEGAYLKHNLEPVLSFFHCLETWDRKEAFHLNLSQEGLGLEGANLQRVQLMCLFVPFSGQTGR